MSMISTIRVGRTKYNKGKCAYPGYTHIIVTASRSGIFKELSPYYLKNEKDQIFENWYQFSKIYNTVPRINVPFSRFNRNNIIWKWGSETHVINGNPTDEYWAWRESGMSSKSAIRYPVGYHNRTKCVGSYKDLGEEVVEGPFDYIETRKELYVPEYIRLIQDKTCFKILQQKYIDGEKILICDVDGPVQDSMDYYKEKYNVSDDWIDQDTITVNKENMEILLNDPKHPFGHGYCLALAILELNIL
jgi:hypothetical protein